MQDTFLTRVNKIAQEVSIDAYLDEIGKTVRTKLAKEISNKKPPYPVIEEADEAMSQKRPYYCEVANASNTNDCCVTVRPTNRSLLPLLTEAFRKAGFIVEPIGSNFIRVKG